MGDGGRASLRTASSPFSRVLSECLALKGRYAEAIETCERALSLDSYREDLHRRLMLYRYCAGEQALALQTTGATPGR